VSSSKAAVEEAPLMRFHLESIRIFYSSLWKRQIRYFHVSLKSGRTIHTSGPNTPCSSFLSLCQVPQMGEKPLWKPPRATRGKATSAIKG